MKELIATLEELERELHDGHSSLHTRRLAQRALQMARQLEKVNQ